MRLWAGGAQEREPRAARHAAGDADRGGCRQIPRGWAFTAVALALTFPIWITVNYLGNPDNGAIFAAYLGSLFMAGGFLAIGACMSAVTRNQVIAFILAIVVCFIFLVAGLPIVLDAFRGWMAQPLVDAIASLSFLTHFRSISKGVIELRDVVYFA
jgi:ABC-2 type transport system permease protein